MTLLSRDKFRETVFQRDNYKCVVCGAPAVDAHHIIDRSLWDDGGYYLDNGVSLCEEHHLAAERTTISCNDLREKAKIKQKILPEHFYSDREYDKWGNIILPTGVRVKGEIFQNENVQKMLREGSVLQLFSPYIKYPRTYHFSFSPGLQNDDKMHENDDFFQGKEVVATVKMDGENLTMYPDYLHARSLDSKNHPSRNYVKQMHGYISHQIPTGWRICGENLYAEHSIHYDNLEDYFLVFSIWDENNFCLSWEDTQVYAKVLGLKLVDEIYKGIYDKEKILNAFKRYSDKSKDEVEGFVVRLSEKFHYKEFRKKVAKYVRSNHVQTDQFWMNKPVVPNHLRKI